MESKGLPAIGLELFAESGGGFGWSWICDWNVVLAGRSDRLFNFHGLPPFEYMSLGISDFILTGGGGGIMVAHFRCKKQIPEGYSIEVRSFLESEKIKKLDKINEKN